MRGRLARSETIQSVLPQTLSDERQAAAVNTTTCLDRGQILDLCELIHTACSGNLPAAGSRTLGLFRCIQIHFVDAQTQSHPGVAGRHPHGLPIHHLKSGGGLHPLDRRTPPNVDTSGEGPRPRSASTSSTAPLVSCWSWHQHPWAVTGASTTRRE